MQPVPRDPLSASNDTASKTAAAQLPWAALAVVSRPNSAVKGYPQRGSTSAIGVEVPGSREGHLVSTAEASADR